MSTFVPIWPFGFTQPRGPDVLHGVASRPQASSVVATGRALLALQRLWETVVLRAGTR